MHLFIFFGVCLIIAIITGCYLMSERGQRFLDSK